MKNFIYNGLRAFVCVAMIFMASCDSDTGMSPTDPGLGFNNGNGSGTGIGGSMARFTIVGDYLYVATDHALKTYSLANPTAPVLQDEYSFSNTAETIFPFKGHVLLGTQQGMLVFGLGNPAKPNYVSQFNHVRSCDPVVASGNYAYVTLRNGVECGRGVNRLDVLDIKDINNPKMVRTIDMTNPMGLGVDNNQLFVCEGISGLKVYSLVDPENPVLTRSVTNIHSYDVIPHANVLMVIGASGLSQYDYSDINNFRHLSTIPVVK